MSVWGKVIGGVAGFAAGGPLGAILGAVAGHAFDAMRSGGRAGAPAGAAGARTALDRELAFTTAIIVLGAKLAKADGRVTRHEVDAFKRLFHIPAREMAGVARIYDRAKGEAAGFEPYAEEVASIFADDPQVLEELLAALFHVALADGAYHPAERAFLLQVADAFGFDAHAFARIESALVKPQEADPYEVLGLPPTATPEEAKAAYRRLIREHHPDALTAKGMPKEFVQLANEKMAAINAAYDRIRAKAASA
jgi:DnaJ like chaperone protein